MNTDLLNPQETGRLKIHATANLLPWISGVEYTEFKRDIAENGVHDPAWVWQEPGKDFCWLVDGRNRRRACMELNRPLPVRHWDGAGSLALFVASLNFHRRMLSTRERIQFAAALAQELEAEARQRQAHGQTAPGRTLSAKLHEASGKSTEQAARVAGVSTRSVATAKAVREQSPRKIAKTVKAGKVSTSDAMRIVGLPEKKQLEALKKVESKAARTLAQAAIEDDLEAACTRGSAKLRAARKLFDRLDGTVAREVVAAIDVALRLAESLTSDE